jgi:acetate---CoA ligase (ADP-forming)
MLAEITGERLTSLFRPRSVALVGASDKSAFSLIAYHNLVQAGLAGRTHLVSRRGGVTHGQPTVTSCAEIGAPVDVAYLMVPQAAMLAALAAHAGSLGMVLLGPNHLGFANFMDRVPVCSIPGLPETPGPVALLSQSGASSSAMVDFATMVNVGLSYLVTLGNEAMITAGHVLDFLVDDPATRAVAMFIETVRDPGTFRRAARRAAEAGKAIVVLKAGSSELAAHTGALTGDDAAIDAVLADLGAIRVDSIEDMLITAGAAAALGRLERPGIGIVSISGGACDIVADRAEDLGASLPELAGPTRDALAGIMPDYGTVQNPLDVTGAAVIDPGIFTRAIEALSQDPSIGVVGVINSLPWADPGGRTWGRCSWTRSAPACAARPAPPPTSTRSCSRSPATPVRSWRTGRCGTCCPGCARPWWRCATWPGRPGPSAARLARPQRSQWTSPSRPPGSGPASGPRTTRAGCSPGRASRWCPPRWPARRTRRSRRPPTWAARSASRSSRRAPAPPGCCSARCAAAARNSWSGSSATRCGGRSWRWRWAACSSSCSTTPCSPRCRSPQPGRRMLEGLRGRAVLDGHRGTIPADLGALAGLIAQVGDLAVALGGDLDTLEINPLRVDGASIEALDAAVTWTRKGQP